MNDNLDHTLEEMRLDMEIKNVEVINTKTKKIEYLSIQELNDVLLKLGMKNEDFFRLCFTLIQGMTFMFDQSRISIRSDFKHNSMAMPVIGQHYFQG